MKFGAWTSVVLLACFVVAIDGQASNLNDFEAKFVDYVTKSTIKHNIRAVNASIKAFVDAVKGLKTAAQTEELQASADVLKPFVEDASEIGYKFTGALTNLVVDPTTPISVLFDEVAEFKKKFRKFKAKKFEAKIEELKAAFGCVGLDEFKDAFGEALDKINEVIDNIGQIGKIVLDSDELRTGKQADSKKKKVSPDPVQLKNQVAALELNIKGLNEKIAEAVKVFKNVMDEIEKANQFLMSYYAMADTTTNQMNATGIQANKTADTQSTSVQNKYYAAQLSIKTNLTNAVNSLKVFSGSKVLKDLSEKNKKSYAKLYNFLQSRTENDIEAIIELYLKLGETTAKSINQTADISIYANNRTALRLADITTEGGTNADSCFNTFSKKLMMPFKTLKSYVRGCVRKETGRWNEIATTVEDILNLIQANSQELAANLGRCASAYVNYATYSEEYVRAKACLETNLEDFNKLPRVLRPLFVNMNNVLKQEVAASIYRTENCLVTNLNEEIEGLKYVRSAMEICIGMPSDCERADREDAEGEMYVRDGEEEIEEKKASAEE